MDMDAPHPHCPFCGLPMHFARAASDQAVADLLHAFDCRWCGVVLNVSPQAEVLQIAISTRS
jgi:hypothetical protein